MDSTRIIWQESIPIGTRIKSWNIDKLLSSSGTFSILYIAHDKNGQVVIKTVSILTSITYVPNKSSYSNKQYIYEYFRGRRGKGQL